MNTALILSLIFAQMIEAQLKQLTQPDSLKHSLQTELGNVPGTFAVAFEDLQTGKQVLINEREMFHAASTMKTPVMIEVFKQASEGKFRLDDSLVVRNEFRSIVDRSSYSLELTDDSDSAMYRLVGKRESIRTLVHHMITVSSNLATNILIELVGPKNVTATMRSLSADSIKVLRGVEDGKAFQLGMNNVTNAIDLMKVFKSIALKQAVNEQACEEMLAMLLDQKFNEKIPGLLPKEVRVAHKTGNITGIEHDSGVVYLPDGRSYVIVLLSKNLKENKEGVAVLARASRLIYEFVRSSK
jgi:beta-lactamase class A